MTRIPDTAGNAGTRNIATAMRLHSPQEARSLGFRAMQFNRVVAGNERAVRLWQHPGFRLADFCFPASD